MDCFRKVLYGVGGSEVGRALYALARGILRKNAINGEFEVLCLRNLLGSLLGFLLLGLKSLNSRLDALVKFLG